MPVAKFSERIGTALVNGSWFQRVLKPYAARVVVMHGHRHVDWIGASGELKIVSAPSPVMAPDSRATHFYVHALGPRPGGGLALMTPTRIDLVVAEDVAGDLALRYRLVVGASAQEIRDPSAGWMIGCRR